MLCLIRTEEDGMPVFNLLDITEGVRDHDFAE